VPDLDRRHVGGQPVSRPRWGEVLPGLEPEGR
jgi:hypothetical protein